MFLETVDFRFGWERECWDKSISWSDIPQAIHDLSSIRSRLLLKIVVQKRLYIFTIFTPQIIPNHVMNVLLILWSGISLLKEKLILEYKLSFWHVFPQKHCIDCVQQKGLYYTTYTFWRGWGKTPKRKKENYIN